MTNSNLGRRAEANFRYGPHAPPLRSPLSSDVVAEPRFEPILIAQVSLTKSECSGSRRGWLPKCCFNGEANDEIRKKHPVGSTWRARGTQWQATRLGTPSLTPELPRFIIVTEVPRRFGDTSESLEGVRFRYVLRIVPLFFRSAFACCAHYQQPHT